MTVTLLVGGLRRGAALATAQHLETAVGKSVSTARAWEHAMTRSKNAGRIKVHLYRFIDHRIPRMLKPYGEISRKALENKPGL